MNLLQDVNMVGFDGARFVLHIPYEREAVATMMELVPGLQYSKKKQIWHAPATSMHVDAIRDTGLPWTKEAKEAVIHVDFKERKRIADSKRAEPETPLVLPGFGSTKKQPFPYQQAGIQYALECERTVIGDEMGLGKTIQALGTVYGAQAYPCLIVCPSTLKKNWADEIKELIPGRNVVIAKKDTPFLRLQLADIIITNYEQLIGFRTYEDINILTGERKKRRTCWQEEDVSKVILSPLAEAFKELKLNSIILDEAHKIKETATGQSQAVLELRHGVKYRLALTGTPLINKPKELIALYKFLDKLDELGGWFYFTRHYCDFKEEKFGDGTNGSSNELELNERLRAVGYIRRKKKDVLPYLPAKTRTSYQVEISNRDEYKHAEDNLIQWVKDRVRQDQKFLDSVSHLPYELQEYLIEERQADKAIRAEKGKAMVMIQALKDCSARGKMKAAKEWIDNFLESGEKLVVFSTHKFMHEWLIKTYPHHARIMSGEDAQKNVKIFQEDPNVQLMIAAMGTSVTNSPAGVGHTLTAASNVLFLELGWNPALHDQCEDRCHRIGQHDNVTCHYLLGADTIDIDIVEIIEGKREIFARVADGDESAGDCKILDMVLARLQEKIAA